MTTKTISRKAKGAIAAVAGGALLLGTGATFAVWSASDTLGGNTVTTGSLAVDVVDLDWTFTGPGGPGELAEIPDFTMIPGHTVTGSGTISPELVGTGLKADLVIDGWEAPELDEMTVTWKVGTTTGTGSSITIPGLTPTTVVDMPITIEIDFPEGSTGTMNETVSLTGLTVTLTQVLETTAP